MTGSTNTNGRALITGASAGLGAELRDSCGSGSLVLVARREERLRELADRLIEEFGVQADVIVADLADPVAPQGIAGTCAQNG